MLHLISENTLTRPVVERIAAGDDVVLQAGSVWAAFAGHADNPKIDQLLAKPCRVFAMQDMLQAFGIVPERMLAGITAIGYPELVELTVENPVIHTWC